MSLPTQRICRHLSLGRLAGAAAAPASCSLSWAAMRAWCPLRLPCEIWCERRGNASGIFASLGRMEVAHLTGVGTRYGRISRVPLQEQAHRV